MLAAKEITTVEEISRALHLTSANTRHHLGVLQDEGQVQVTGTRKPTGRGRPIQLYQLSQPRQEHNLDNLSHILLGVIQAEHNQKERPVTLEHIAAQLAMPDSKADVQTKPNLGQKLSKCVKHLNRLHYKARWEAHTGGPRLILGHCPYWAIIYEHPELCQVDKRLIEISLDVEVDQTAKLEPNSLGLPNCIFLVKTTPVNPK